MVRVIYRLARSTFAPAWTVRIMTLIRPVWVCLTFLVFLIGCASAPSHISTDSAHWVDPIHTGSSAATGWLVVRVNGSPRNIVYSLNGVRLEPEERVEWWKEAEIRLQLRPGFYELEATYDVRAFAGRGIEYRIVTRHPLEVRAGAETEVEAHLEKDWRGVPANETAFFSVVTEERRARKAAAAEATVAAAGEVPKPTSFSSGAVPMTVNPQATPEILEEVRLADALAAATVADQIVIHGNQYDSASGTVMIQNASDSQPVTAEADNITIIGPEDAASPTNADLGLPVAASGAAAAAAPLSAGSSASFAPAPTPYTLEGSEEFGITVQIESVPSGAQVSVDEQVVGQTPVQVRMDPRADHIIEFAYDGCGDYVRLLSSTSWREGRSTTVQVQLYCD